MRVQYKIVLVTCLLTINILGHIQCGSLLGRAGVLYTTTHNIFKDQQSAIGLVRMANGFTLAPAAAHGSSGSVYMDTCISVSGAIDLRETNTIILLADLNLDNGVTFSSGGRLYGYDRELILNGDLTIPAGKVIHTGGRVVINGQGHTLNLGGRSQLFVDTGATLTLKNLIVQGTLNSPGSPVIQCASSRSQLCLDNAELDLPNDFYFNQGSMFVHNDVAVTGTSAFFYSSCQPSFITSGAKLYFDVGTTLDFYPSTTGTPSLLAKDLLFMSDSTSQLYLNGCTLKSTYTGFRLTQGQLLFDNKVSMTSAAALRLVDFSTTVTNWQASSRAACVDWHPSGKYVAFGVDSGPAGSIRFVVLGFNGTSFTPITQTATWLIFCLGASWSPDGRYLACAGQDSSNTYVRVYSFNGATLTQVAFVSSGGTEAWTARWSPDGRYLAVSSNWSSNQLAIYAFTGVSLNFVTSANVGGISFGSCWNPDGQTIAVGNAGSGLAIYKFTGSSLVSLDSDPISGAADTVWSPDGRFLATAASTAAAPMFWVHYFTGSALVRVASYTGTTGASGYTASWDKTGRYVAFCGQDATTANFNAIVFQLVGNTLSQVGTFKLTNSYARGIAFSPDNNFLAIAGNAANSPSFEEVQIQALHWKYETQTQALSNAIVFGNSALGASYDLYARVLAGSQVVIDGILNDDNVN